VVEGLEAIEDYRSFEAAVIADYDARTAVDRELVLRLASLSCRLRRATAMETDLLRIQAETTRDLKFRREAGWTSNIRCPIFAGGTSSARDVVHDALQLRVPERSFGEDG